MPIYPKYPVIKGINPLASLLLIEIFLGIIIWYPFKASEAEALVPSEQLINSLGALLIQNNSLLPLSDLITPPRAVSKRVVMVITAYSSSVWETDGDPHTTAAGTTVRPGIVANNMLPMGTKVRLPELYGDQVFVVEDRMNSRKGKYQIDIWFPSYQEAKNFGFKKTYVDILEN